MRYLIKDGKKILQHKISRGDQNMVFNDGSECVMPKFVWVDVPEVEAPKEKEEPKKEK